MKYIILIPTYNEAENVERIVSSIFDLYKDIYVKIIDDNSPDGTALIVHKLVQKYPHLSLLSRKGKEGLGKAYMNGFMEVMRDPAFTHIIMMDADMSHNPVYIKDMIRESEKYDLVIGSRYIQGGGTVGWEMWRKMLSLCGNLYGRMITRMPINDMTGGFNCIKIDNLKKIDLNTVDASGYAFQMQLKYSQYLSGVSIKEIPIIFSNRFGGESKISNNIISEGIIAPWKMILKK